MKIISKYSVEWDVKSLIIFKFLINFYLRKWLFFYLELCLYDKIIYNLEKTAMSIDNIIKNVHRKISIDDTDNNIETLSVSDEEITSIIEDTADIQILKGGRGRPKKGTRTLNI